MLIKNIAGIVCTIGIIFAAAWAVADDETDPPKEKTIFSRIDSFGKSLFGGILPAEKPKSKNAITPKSERPSTRKSAMAEPPERKLVTEPIGGRAGSIPGDFEGKHFPDRLSNPVEDAGFMPENTPLAISRPADGPRERPSRLLPDLRADRTDLNPSTAVSSRSVLEDDTIPALRDEPVARATDGTPKRVRRPLAQTSLLDGGDLADTAPSPLAGDSSDATAPAAGQSRDSAAELPHIGKTPSQPLHERMTGFRKSVFSPNHSSDVDHESTATPNRPTRQTTEVAENDSPENELRKNESAAAEEKVVAPSVQSVGARPVVTTPTQSPAIEPEVQTPSRGSEAAEEVAAETQQAPPAAAVENEDGLLIARKGPMLSVETLGPRRINVGKESTYEVSLVNSGDMAAEEMVVFLSLPEWAEVAGIDVSMGTVPADAKNRTTGMLQWNLGHLESRSRERLTLKIIPRQSRPFDLAVRWEYKPVASQTAIEVQEPKLVLQIEGPREVLYGKKESYRLKLLNVGNGAAENVSLMLMPIGGGEGVPATHKIGTLPAGEEKALDVELTARQAGNLTIQMDARADGDVRAELAEKVVVRRAGLKVDVEGPNVQFVGGTAAYAIRVRNTGTAPARDVQLSLLLPAGAKYLAGIENARLDATGGKLEWSVDAISPEVEQAFMVKCSLGTAGVSRVQLTATAADDLTASADTVTSVESVANVTMEVRDPAGPVAVGDEAIYEVIIRNRGTKEASAVEVFAYFSRGIEPTSAEGGPNQLGSGQVTFQPIPRLVPGAEVILKVRAKAEAPGNHVFRAEAQCKPLGTRLIREATNLYYTDSSAAQTARQSQAETPSPDTPRTGSRPAQGNLLPVPPRG